MLIVINKLVIPFSPENKEELLSKVRAFLTLEDRLDFSLLIPPPPQIYIGNLAFEGEKDFQCNWSRWNTENWGTKWNVESSSFTVKKEEKVFEIVFNTAWTIPYPVISAINNRLQVPFVHRYFEEGSSFWGIEIWGRERLSFEAATISRIEKRYSLDEDYRSLFIELKGYDPEEG